MKKIIIITVIAFCTISMHAQVLSNKPTSAGISKSNVMLDGSTNFSAQAGTPNNIGKGIIIPSVDLTTFQFLTSFADGITFPTYFDGMIVYNNKAGNTVAGQGVQTAVTPGFYYFYNPNATGIATGVWKPLGGSGAGEPWNVVGSTTQAGSNSDNIYQSGKVGIGASYSSGTITSTLEVDGAATNKTSFSAGTGVAVDFTKSNLAYSTSTSTAPAFTCSGMKDGGTYTLAWQGGAAGIGTITATGLSVKMVATNPAKIATQDAVYTIVCIGTTAYVYVTLF